jgi:hypothetical protein
MDREKGEEHARYTTDSWLEKKQIMNEHRCNSSNQRTKAPLFCSTKY